MSCDSQGNGLRFETNIISQVYFLYETITWHYFQICNWISLLFTASLPDSRILFFNGTVGTKIQLEAICSKTYVVLYFLRVLSSLVMFTVFLFCPVIKGGLISLLLKIYYKIYVMAEHSLWCNFHTRGKSPADSKYAVKL